MDIAAYWVTIRHILDVAKQWCSEQLANSILLILSYYMQDCMYLVYFNAPVIWTYPTPIPSRAWWGTGTKILSNVPAPWYWALQTTNPNPNTIQSGSVLMLSALIGIPSSHKQKFIRKIPFLLVPHERKLSFKMVQFHCLSSEALERKQRRAPPHLFFMGKAFTNNSL